MHTFSPSHTLVAHTHTHREVVSAQLERCTLRTPYVLKPLLFPKQHQPLAQRTTFGGVASYKPHTSLLPSPIVS